MTGQAVERASISGISNAERCEITASAAHGLTTEDRVRVTDIGNVGPNSANRGFENIVNKRFVIVVTSTTTFLIKDEITNEYIDSTNYTPYVSGGYATKEQTQFVYEGD